ncbi:MAG: nucleoside 2-deoxyribosyltransferase [Chloroflexota bacterium]
MKIYFAGPLFTPYVRQFISENAKILRENGIEPFVPHENLFGKIDTQKAEDLHRQGLLTAEYLEGRTLVEAAEAMVHDARLTRDQAGLPAISPELVFKEDYAGLSSADAVLAILDGTQVDDGTACELGIYFGLSRTDPSKKGIIGLMTDSRGIRKKEIGYGLNYFVLGILEEIGTVVCSFPDALEQLKKWQSEIAAENKTQTRSAIMTGDERGMVAGN